MTSREFPPIGMSPDVWGPIFWNTMHIASLGYADEPNDDEKKAATAFFNSLKYIIPCPICRFHYTTILETNPVEPAVASRAALVEWVYVIHNKVNKELGKPEITWEAYMDAILKLSNSMSGKKSDFTWAYALIAGIGIGVGAYAFYKMLK